MNHRHRLVAAVGALTLVVVGCGGDDEATEAEPAVTTGAGGGTGTAPATDPAPATAPADGDGPNATVAPDLPEELAGQIGPVEVVGQPLPPLDPAAPITDDPARGMPAPVLVGQAYDGTTVRVDAAAEGPTLVVFLAHWCPHCNAEVPRINELRDAGSFPADLKIVAVSTAIDPTRPNFPPSQWLQDVDWTYPAIADGVDMQAQNYIGTTAYGVTGFPFVTLIDGDGNVAARWSGEHEPEEFLELITSNL